MYHTGARCSDFPSVKKGVGPKHEEKLSKRTLTIQFRFTKNRRDINDRMSIQYKLPPKTVINLEDFDEATRIGTAKCNRAMATLTRRIFPQHRGRPPTTFSFRRRFKQMILKGEKSASEIIAIDWPHHINLQDRGRFLQG